jgi:hypothetical protein
MPWAQESLENFLTEPGRGDARYLNDRSAFDVFLGCRTAAGGRAFIGIEVKYHENLVGTDGRHQARYDEVADRMGCFLDGREPLKSSPLQQIWRDHLLAGITRIVDGYADAVFAVLYPRDNPHVSAALNDYRKQLSNSNSFAAWTLEHMVSQLRDLSDASWIDLFSDRYLAFDKIDSRLSGTD